MNRTLKGLMLCASLLATATVSADRESFSKFVAQKEAAAVTLECVFEVKSSYGGQEQQMERKVEVDGFVIDEKGTVISTMSNVDPGSFYAKAMGSEDSYSTRIKSLKYIFPDNTEVPAAVVLRDTDLNIAVLKPLTPPEKPMTFSARRWKRGRLSVVMPILPYHSASKATSPISGKSFFSARRAQAL